MNRLFLVTITGECSLFYLHGLRPRHYNPFVLLRKVLLEKHDIKLPKNHENNLRYLEQLYKDNEMELHKVLVKALAKATEKGK